MHRVVTVEESAREADYRHRLISVFCRRGLSGLRSEVWILGQSISGLRPQFFVCSVERATRWIFSMLAGLDEEPPAQLSFPSTPTAGSPSRSSGLGGFSSEPRRPDDCENVSRRAPPVRTQFSDCRKSNVSRLRNYSAFRLTYSIGAAHPHRVGPGRAERSERAATCRVHGSARWLRSSLVQREDGRLPGSGRMLVAR
jgi:hypothetical protein